MDNSSNQDFLYSSHNLTNGFCVRHYRELDSTNSEAMRLAIAGESDRLWVLAEQQNHGKGRSGRQWISQPGNFHASLYVKMRCDLSVLAQLSLVAGLCAYETLRDICPETILKDLRLKWPNDIILFGSKMGGMLLETYKPPQEDLVAVIMGTGFNLIWHPVIDDRKTTNLLNHDIQVPPIMDILEKLSEKTERWLSLWEHGKGFQEVCQTWMSYSQEIGEQMKVHIEGKKIYGRYAGLDDNGNLLLQTESGGIETINVGDVYLC